MYASEEYFFIPPKLCELWRGEEVHYWQYFLEQHVCTVSGFAVILIAHTNVIAFLLVPDV